MSNIENCIKKIIGFEHGEKNTLNQRKILQDLTHVGLSLGLIERVGKKAGKDSRWLELLNAEGQIEIPEFYLGVSDSLRVHLYVKDDTNGTSIDVFNLLESKFAKLSFLFVQDFFLEEHAEFLSAWRGAQKENKTLELLGPFSYKVCKQSLGAGEPLIGKSQVSPLLALCQKMVEQTPVWVIEGLKRMEQHYYEQEKVVVDAENSRKKPNALRSF